MVTNSDAGTEFTSSAIRNFMAQHNFLPVILVGSVKAHFAERVIRTLQNLASSMQETLRNFDIYTDLKSLEETYNNQEHTSIGTTPAYSLARIDTPPIWENHNIPKSIIKNDYVFDFKKNKLKIDMKLKKSKFKIMDTVRLATKNVVFTKSSVSKKFTNEIFLIKSLHRPILEFEPIQYKLVDMRNRPIQGRFYDFEIKQAKLPHKIIIQSIEEYKNGIFYVTIQSLPSGTQDGILFKLNKSEIKPSMLSFRAKLQYNNFITDNT